MISFRVDGGTTLAKSFCGSTTQSLKEVPPHHFSSLVGLEVKEDPRLGASQCRAAFFCGGVSSDEIWSVIDS